MSKLKSILAFLVASAGGILAYLKFKKPEPKATGKAEEAVAKAKTIIEQVKAADVARAAEVKTKIDEIQKKADEVKAQDSVDVANDIIAGL